MTTGTCTQTGPLVSSEVPDHRWVLDIRTGDAATWLAFVGLGGRYAFPLGHRYWRRWNGSTWEECHTEEVHRDVRRVLGALFDRCMEASPSATQTMKLLRLMDLNWRLGPLMTELRLVCRVPPERLL